MRHAGEVDRYIGTALWPNAKNRAEREAYMTMEDIMPIFLNNDEPSNYYKDFIEKHLTVGGLR